MTMTDDTSRDAAAESLVSEDWTLETDDLMFRSPFVDQDEWRQEPVPHRYVHGGFKGTETLFSFYLPGAGKYEGRFFQHVTPFPQSELLGPTVSAEYNKIAFALASGGYFVETNGGGARAGDPTGGMDPTISAYRANAAVAQFSRTVAQRIFGQHRVYGYLYGGSGGGYRTIGAAENTVGAWDGFAPHVIGSSVAIPNVFSVRMHALRVLADRFPQIVDAFDAGGDLSSLELTSEQREAFDEVTRMGFPPRSWFGWKTMDLHGFSALYPGVIAADPTYTTDYWSVPGYLGADPDSSVHAARVRLHARVAELVRADPDTSNPISGGVDESFKGTTSDVRARVVAIRMSEPAAGFFLGAELRIVSGAAEGMTVRLSGVSGDRVTVEGWNGMVPEGLEIGDEVVLDNSNFLAVQTYHRHQVPGPEFAVWDQFRDADGEPLYPQRPMLLGPLMSKGATGVEMTGRIAGKMIVIEAGLDREAFPWQADWYRGLVSQQLGDAIDDQFRVWIHDNALHGDEGPQEFPGRSVPYLGALEAALRQLTAWVEGGIAPSPSTAYEVVDGQVLTLATAAGRGGVQPVATLRANGGERTEVSVGEEVSLLLEAEAVEGIVVDAYEIITGPDGEERVGERLSFEPARAVTTTWKRVFTDRGTNFVSVRFAAQTDGDPGDSRARAENLVRARVVVV